MGKLVFAVACIVLFTILFSSATFGDEQNQAVKKAFQRELREAGVKPGKIARKKKSLSGRNKNGQKGRKNMKNKNGKKSNKGNKGRKSQKNKLSNGKKGRKSQKNKGRKSKKKKIPKAKKGRKSQKKTKQSRKNQKKTTNGKPRTKSSENGCSRQTTSTFCPTEKATSLKLLYNQVYNFKKQLKRAQNQVGIVKKKKIKEDSFQKDATILTDVVGGNLTNPTCSSSSASSAASQGTILSSCSTNIATSCEDITINSTLSGACSDTMTTFETKVTACKASDTCACWTEAVAMKSDITACSAVNEANTVKAKKTICLKTFSECKKAQDSAVEYTATCPTQTSSATTMATASTTKSAKRRNLVEKFLARNLLARNRGYHNVVSA